MITWKKVKVKYGPWPLAGYVGSIEMFRIAYTLLTPDKTKPYLLFIWLPSETGSRGDQDMYAATVEELKQIAEKTFVEWLGKAELKMG